MPISSTNRFAEVPAHLLENHSNEKLPYSQGYSYLQSAGTPFSIVSVTATPVCSGEASSITIVSIPSSLPDGTYTVTYDLDTPNTSSGNTATMAVAGGSGKGTFTTRILNNVGNTNITITNLSDGTNSNPISAGNTANINVSIAPEVTIGAPVPAICMGETTEPLGASVTANGYPTWSTPDGGTFSDIHNPNATWTPASGFTGTATLKLTATNGCAIVYDTKTVEVKTFPVVNIGPVIDPICQGGTSDPLGGSVGGSATGGMWTSSAGGTFSPLPTDIYNAQWTPPLGYSGTATLTLTSTGSPCDIPDSKTIVVNPTSTGGIASATDPVICSGNNTTITLTGYTGTIQWQSSTDNSNFTNISGANSATYNTPNLTVTTYYKAIVTSGVCSSATSSTAQVTVNPTSIGGTATATDPVICSENNTTISLTGYTGTIQWQSSTDNSTFTNITGANSATYTTGNLTTTTYYRAVVTSGVCSSVNSSSAQVTVNPTSVGGTATATDPVICSGSNTTISLTGYTGTIQWQSSTDNVTFNNISGATSPTYTTGSLMATTYYRAVVKSGVCNSDNSNVITITVNPTSVGGTASATDPVICSGNNTTISLTGQTGTIQWQSSTDNSTFTNITGANSATYTTGNLTVTTYYRAVVTSGVCSSINSSTAQVTVNPTSVGGTATATDPVICSGSNTTISLTGQTGTIQWQQSPDGTNWSNVTGGSGATTSTYTTPNLLASTYYRAVVTSGVCNSDNSNAITITVNPTSVGGTATATNPVVCSGSGTIVTLSGYTGTIQWQSSTDNSTFINITGANTATYNTPNLTFTTYYRAVVTSGVCSSANSSTAQVTVNPTSVGGTATATDPVVCSGSNTTISLTGQTGTIQWQQSPNGTSGWTNISGATSSPYPTGNLIAITYYRAVVTSGVCSSANSTTAQVTVNPTSVGGTATAMNPAICSGSGTTLSLAGNTGTIQWQQSPNGTSGWVDISGATSSAYTTPNLTATTFYRAVVISGVCPSANSNSVTVTVNPLPLASISGTTAVCKDALSPVVTFTGSAGTAPYTFTYKLNGGADLTITSTGNTATLSIPTNATGVFTYSLVSVKDASSTTCSNTANGSAIVTVNPLPVPTITGSITSCSGSTGNTYSTEAGMTGYVWSVSAGGTITSGQGTKDITVSWSTAGAQAVSVKYTDANSCTASPETIKSVLVNPTPTVSITNPAAVCFPSTVDLTDTAIKSGSTAGLTYTYWTDATATISLANPATAGAGTYWIMGTTAAGCSDIKPVTVTVNPKPTVVITNPAAVCSPATIDLSAATVTSGSTTGLAYTYWTNAAATISLANHTTVSVSGTYYIKGTNSNGCFDIQPVTVVVNQTPSVTNASTKNVCSGSSTNITLTSDVTGTTYTWTLGTITGTVTGATSGSGGSINQVLTSSGNGGTVQYIVTPTSPAGCIGAPFTITVTVQTPPTVWQQPEDPNLICDDGFATFISHAYGLPTPTVRWQVSTNGGSSWTNLTDMSGITGSTTDVLSVYDPPSGRKYRAVYTNTGACGPQTVYSNVSTVSVSGDVKIFAPFAVNGCGDGTYTLFIELQGDQVSKDDADAWAEYFDGTTWREVPNSHQTLRNGHPTYSYDISYNDYAPGTLFKIIILTKKCSIIFNTNPLPFGVTGQITVANTCVNTPVTFSQNGAAGGTWTIKDPSGTTIYTLANATGSTLTYTPTGAPGCYSATYQSGICSDTKGFIVFPQVVTNPTLQQSVCGNALTMTPAAIDPLFTTEYSIQTPGSSTWSAYRDLNATKLALTNTPGCWTIKSRYKTAQACDLNAAGIISPCAESSVSAVVFPAAPVLSAPFNTCNAQITLPGVPAISGFTTEWKIDGGTYTATPTIPSAPGCHTFQARYVLTSSCGTTPAGPSSLGCESNIVSAVIFPAAPSAPTLSAGCGATITVTPPSPVPAGFSVEYSFNNGAAGSWTASNTFTAPSDNCTGYLIKTRYVLSSACGTNGAGTASSLSGCTESPATLRKVDTSAPVLTCTTPFPAPVCVNTGNTYVHSGINWDATVSDNCTITSITASTSGATTLTGLTTIKGAVFNIGTTTVTWSASDGCNTSTCSFTVTVNPKPYINDMSATICSGNSFILTPLDGTNGVVPSGTTYTWSAPTVTGGITGGAAGTNAASIQGTLINPTNTVQTATYTVVPTAGSCPGASFKITVTVNPTPAINAMTTMICSGSSFTLTPANGTNGIVPAGTTYTWSAPVVTGGVTGGTAGTNAANFSGTLTNPTNTVQTATYTVTPTSGTCPGANFTVTVTVNPIPVVADQTPPAICSGSSFTVTPTGVPAGTTYSWTAPVVAGITGATSGTNASSISGTLTNITNAPINVVYTVTPQSGSCPGPSFTVTLIVNPLPACSITGANGPLCPLLSGNIYTAPAGMSAYLWTISGNATIQGANNQQTVSVTAGAGCNTPFDLTLTVTDINGCISTCIKSVVVQDNTNPVFLADPPSKSFCVVDILQATFDNQTEPDADIIASYNPLYEPTTDILKDRPDYYVLQANDLDLSPLTYFSDNCTTASNLILHWKITDSANQPIKDINNNTLSDITGNISTYISSVSPITLYGATNLDVAYTISYWLEDACGKLSSVKTATITIKPRPNIIKTTY